MPGKQATSIGQGCGTWRELFARSERRGAGGVGGAAARYIQGPG